MKAYCALFFLAAAVEIPLSATVLFSNGDPDGYGNFLDCSTCRAAGGVKIYDDFVVGGSGWTVTGLSGAYFFSSTTFLPTQASWEIRQGLSQGVYGTVVASGTGAITLTSIANPVVASVFSYSISISISPLALAPGRYWATLAPDSSGNEPLIWAAAGANGVNAQINGESYVTGPYWPSMQNVGAYLQPFTHISAYDFAMQVTGSEGIPEPSTMGLIGIGLVAVGVSRRRK